VAETIPIDRISTEGTQTRAELNQTVIAEYAEAYEQGIELPPIDVYYDDMVYWLADGFHRVRALQQIGRDTVPANVHHGSQREALVSALGANETHGLRRTNADRRQAVMIMLNDPEWSGWANTEIARQCHVSEYLVRTIRSEITPSEPEPVKEKTRQARRGTTTYPMKTENIGAKKSRRKAADVVEPGSAELQQDSTSTPIAQVSSIESKIEPDASTTAPAQESPRETAPVASTEPEVPAATVELEPIVTFEATPIPAELEPGPSISLPLAVSVISAAAAAELSLEDAWEWATQADRENFVVQHRDELQKIFRKLEKGATS
jgi:ParB-like nuclease domain